MTQAPLRSSSKPDVEYDARSLCIQGVRRWKTSTARV